MVIVFLDGAGHDCALAPGCGDRQMRAQEAGTIPHDLQAHALEVDRRFGKSDAVVLNAERGRRAVALQADLDVPGARVLEGVGDRLAGD